MLKRSLSTSIVYQRQPPNAKNHNFSKQKITFGGRADKIEAGLKDYLKQMEIQKAERREKAIRQGKPVEKVDPDKLAKMIPLGLATAIVIWAVTTVRSGNNKKNQTYKGV